MKVSNFRLIEVIGKTPLNLRYRALIDVTEKSFMRKPVTIEKEVYKTYAGSWYLVETGEYAPSSVSDLARKCEAENGEELENCAIHAYPIN